MKRGWTEVALGEVIVQKKDSSVILPDVEYKEVTVSLWGRGVRLRKRILGSEISASTRNQTATNDFIISKIDARHGAYGFIPEELDGAVVSNDFPLFKLSSENLCSRWLYWISLSNFFVDLCRRASKGTTNRIRLKESLFLDLKIPLPPLAEQQRIVAHLDAIEQRLKRIQKLREESEKKTLALVQSCIHEEHCKGIRHIPMSELVEWRKPDTDVFESESYTFAGVYSFGRGVFRKEAKSGMEFKYDRLTRLKANEFTYPKLMAWEGALGIVPEECDGCFVSPEFPVFTVNADKILPEIIDIHFKSPLVWTKLGRLSTGTNLRRRRLNPNAFLEYVFPLPPMDVQKGISALSFRVKKKADLARQASIRQEALIPSLLDSIFNS